MNSAHRILRLLAALRDSPAGTLIYRQVEQMLDEDAECRQQVEQGCAALVRQLLDAYLGHLDEASTLRLQVRLLQARLEPPLTLAEVTALRDYAALFAARIESLPGLDEALLQEALRPLLSAFGLDHEADTAESAPAPSPAPEPVPEAPAAYRRVQQDSAAAEEAAPAVQEEVPAREAPPETADVTESSTPAVESPAGVVAAAAVPGSGAAGSEDEAAGTERPSGGSRRRDILQLQSTLARQVMETISQNEEFGVLLEVVLGELRRSPRGMDLEDLRWSLIREIEKLTKGHHELAEKLDNTYHYLQLVESDSRQLSDELTRVRLLSLTDELTGLPNRRAFLRRIEDEVARVQRYGFPLSLALIDLDHFKQVNDRYGHAGGDEVLKIYSRNILSIFRHHDLVARYGGEEFAVLLPNTEEEGSMRALNKVKARAGETRWQCNDEMIPVPTFSAGVSLYKPGETASAFIERADKALYRAKKLGRNRVELDATYQSSTVATEAGSPGKQGAES